MCLLCVGLLGVDMWECVFAKCGKFCCGFGGLSLCCVWDRVICVRGSECVLCVGQFIAGLGSECVLLVGMFGVGFWVVSVQFWL